MKRETYFYETASARMLEFDKIIEQLKELAYTEKAKEQIKSLRPSLSETEVKSWLRQTSEAVLMLEKCGTPPVTAQEDMGEMLQIAEKGGCLTAEQLEKFAINLTAVKRLKDYLCRGKAYDIGLPYYEENLDSLEEIRTEITEKIRSGRVDDYASKLLKSLREGIDRTKAKMQEKAESIIRANKECMSDSFTTTRNGHLCVPVKKEYKFRISGSVIDKSSTGNTLFIEPTSVAKLYEELQLLLLDEENEERRILYTLTAMLADEKEVVEGNNRTIEKVDFLFAKGKLSLRYAGTEPQMNTKRYIRLANGRHPLMDKAVNVPLQFEIGRGVNGVIITGPNTGGKTVAIKTVALNALMAQCGLHVACESADICMNNLILCDIGDGQNLAENLSTFSAHITNVLAILDKADEESLVIMDELGSGTDPTEGMGIAIAILQELKNLGCLYLVTTHYPEIKTYAEKEEGVVNARMTFDKESLKPLYQLVIGEAGESCAFYIARKLGMPLKMLKRAEQAAYGSAYGAANANLRGVAVTMEFQDGDEDAAEAKAAGRNRENRKSPHVKKQKTVTNKPLSEKFKLGDSVMVYPDKKIGIVCEPVNEKGVLRVQMPDKKIYINHKRVKLHVAAEELYPEDYDFSIIFETVENRKKRHDMERKYTEEMIYHEEQ
ncbi:MAG: DNA mismatch repair protein MutS [Lachnospiraceae bacterium]|nr:DNA mismatch repair protein MutS [Lachnospiraceae bacterium]